MLDCYANALWSKPHRVLGRALRPFSLIHAATLEAARSPYVCGGIPTIADLFFAVWVCSRDWRAINRAAGHGSAGGWWARAMDWRARRMDFAAEQAKMAEYLAYYTKTQERWKRQGESAGPSVNWCFCVAWRLLSSNVSAATEAHVWNMPLNRALSYCSAAAEAGGAEFVSETEAEFVESQHRAAAERAAAERKAADNG